MASDKAMGWLITLLYAERGQEMDEARLSLWSEILSDVPDELLRVATFDVLKTQVGQFPITVGAIYQSALKLAKRAMPTSGEAWEMAMQAIRDCNYLPGTGLLAPDGWKPVHRLPYLVRRAAEQVGIMTLANGNTGAAERARFIEFYDSSIGVFERPILSSGGSAQRFEEIAKEYDRALPSGNPALAKGGDDGVDGGVPQEG